MDIIILGASNTGKTSLGNFLASSLNLPIFNCDSVQIYKYLNSVTSKPEFTSQEIIDGEVVSYLPVDGKLDFEKYKNIRFKVWVYDSEGLKNTEFDSVEELVFFTNNNFKSPLDSRLRGNDKEHLQFKNYLFDIREPLEAYSTVDFEQDLNRISKKFDIKNRIIVGGTVYYAYNFLLGLNNFEEGNEVFSLQSTDYSQEEMLEKLEELDAESLNLIDIKNPRRVQSAWGFINKTGKKYSENYKKEETLRDNFILIELLPKSREEYYKSLDKIIDGRLISKTFEEIAFLLRTYPAEVSLWLEKVSYEYKYFLQIYFLLQKKGVNLASNLQDEKEVQEILQQLKYKEHQYAKRQMTFLRRLEKKFLNGAN